MQATMPTILQLLTFHVDYSLLLFIDRHKFFVMLNEDLRAIVRKHRARVEKSISLIFLSIDSF